MINLFLDSINDEKIRDVFKKLTNYLEGRTFLKGEWQFFEIIVQTGATISYPHQLKIRPKDVITTSVTGPGTVVWNYSLFSSTSFSFTASSATPSNPVTIRAFIGSYDGGN